MQTTGPYTLTLGEDADVTAPLNNYRQAVLANASPYACTVQTNAGPQWLQPFSADLFDAGTGGTLTVTPSFTTSSVESTNQLTATWYNSGETPTGTFPVALTSQAIASIEGTITATIEGDVGAITAGTARLAASGSGTCTTSPPANVQPIITLEAQDRAVAIVYVVTAGSPDELSVTVKGATTGGTLSIAATPGEWVVLPVYGIVDGTAQVFIGGGNATIDYWIVALPDPLLQLEPVETLELVPFASQGFSALVSTGTGAVTVVPDAPTGYLCELDPNLSITGASSIAATLTLTDAGSSQVFFSEGMNGQANPGVPRYRTDSGVAVSWADATQVRVSGAYSLVPVR